MDAREGLTQIAAPARRAPARTARAMRLRRRATLLAACAALAARARAGEQLMTLSSVTQFDARAVCNDGSDAGYYYSPATGQPDVWLVMLEGARAAARDGHGHSGSLHARMSRWV
jgi:hypothetical protein